MVSFSLFIYLFMVFVKFLFSFISKVAKFPFGYKSTFQIKIVFHHAFLRLIHPIEFMYSTFYTSHRHIKKSKPLWVLYTLEVQSKWTIHLFYMMNIFDVSYHERTKYNSICVVIVYSVDSVYCALYDPFVMKTNFTFFFSRYLKHTT